MIPPRRDDVRPVPLPSRNVENLPAERRIDLSHEMVSFWWNRSGRYRRTAVAGQPGETLRQWRWSLDEMYVKQLTMNLHRPSCGWRRAVGHIMSHISDERTQLSASVDA